MARQQRLLSGTRGSGTITGIEPNLTATALAVDRARGCGVREFKRGIVGHEAGHELLRRNSPSYGELRDLLWEMSDQGAVPDEIDPKFTLFVAEVHKESTRAGRLAQNGDDPRAALRTVVQEVQEVLREVDESACTLWSDTAEGQPIGLYFQEHLRDVGGYGLEGNDYLAAQLFVATISRPDMLGTSWLEQLAGQPHLLPGLGVMHDPSGQQPDPKHRKAFHTWYERVWRAGQPASLARVGAPDASVAQLSHPSQRPTFVADPASPLYLPKSVLAHRAPALTRSGTTATSRAPAVVDRGSPTGARGRARRP